MLLSSLSCNNIINNITTFNIVLKEKKNIIFWMDCLNN